MSLNELLSPLPKEWAQLNVNKITANMITTDMFTTNTFTANIITANVIQPSNQEFPALQIANIMANPYNADAQGLVTAYFYIPFGSPTATFNLPTVASVKTYLQSIGVSLTSNASFKFKIINNTIGTVNITNGGDANWSFVTSLASPPYPLVGTTTVEMTVVVGSGATGFILA